MAAPSAFSAVFQGTLAWRGRLRAPRRRPSAPDWSEERLLQAANRISRETWHRHRCCCEGAHNWLASMLSLMLMQIPVYHRMRTQLPNHNFPLRNIDTPFDFPFTG
jgi:hypothetical protein